MVTSATDVPLPGVETTRRFIVLGIDSDSGSAAMVDVVTYKLLKMQVY